MGRAKREVLDAFLPPVATWFRERFGAPTPPQRLGWPEVAAGRHTLLFAPTGSGKTLAAFLACLDHLWRQPRRSAGVRILYISPLKALNEDVSRNLEGPLAEVLATAERLGTPLEPITVAVRTGDTPTAARQKMVRKPPDILITTPESLHLILTSRAREMLRGVSHVLVDEIHALCGNKRGVFLSLLLERLETLCPGSFVRVGLSATQRPLEEVARYLGGRRKVSGQGASARFEPRPVAIVDAGQRKALDLQVAFPSSPDGAPRAGSVWPAIEERLLALIAAHRSTIVFANNRRVAERLTAQLNERAGAAIASDLDPPEGAEAPEPVPLARAHHGSLSLAARRSTESALKAGELAAVVATASLELGIDMGAVDLVCQVESPGSLARGLQRVGRAGHLVGQTSVGRLLAKTNIDLLETAALAHGMMRGDVERLRVPTNCLDVLAQQVVACVAGGSTAVDDLFDLVRGAYSYRDLTPAAFEAVLAMVAGRYGVTSFRDLKPRLSWDRVHHQLHPLPGTAQQALVGGGTIPDTGQFPLHLGSPEGPRLGELDEEFVFERRVGETFRFGSSTWQITAIDPQRVVVAPAAGRSALLPFWRGEGVGRTAELGEAVGALSRELAARIEEPGVEGWLAEVYRLEPAAATALVSFVRRQLRQAGAVPDDRTVLVELFRDPAGEIGLAILTPFGTRLHHALKLALLARLRRRLGIEVACLHADDGLLLRLPGLDDPPLDLFRDLSGELAESLIREELGESALFGLRFRQNACRSLLMPRPDPSKRTPLWLQRLRARDLLQAVRKFPDFPVVVETFRECLDDDLDLPRLRSFLDGIQAGSIRLVERRAEVASPFASELVFKFTQAYLYEWDEPRRGSEGRASLVDEALLDPLLDREAADRILDPDAIARVDARLRGVSRPPRSVAEMAEWLTRLGDLAPSELAGPMALLLDTLEREGRATRIALAGTAEPARWIAVEDAPLYAAAFGPDAESEGNASVAAIVRRFLQTRALVGLHEVTARYPIDPAQATELLESLVREGELVQLEGDGTTGPRWSERGNLDEARRLTIALRRRESVAVAPEVFADFVSRLQRIHPETRLEGEPALDAVLETLVGWAAPLDAWEAELLPRRISDFRPGWLATAVTTGGWRWRAAADGRGEPRVGFLDREFAGPFPVAEPEGGPGPATAAVEQFLQGRGACEVAEIVTGTGLKPGAVRAALAELLASGRATSDRLDPLREAGRQAVSPPPRPPTGRGGRPRLGAFRRALTLAPEPRWSLWGVAAADGDPGDGPLAWASALLGRYGVLCRETVALDPWAPPWREIVPHLVRAELRGELRRGYFVEGLSGVQFALAETADALARSRASEAGEPRPYLIGTLDPANLYGVGAPLDIPLLEGGTARLLRNPSNALIMLAGRPVLVLEAQGRRLTGLPSATPAELDAALGLLPGLAHPGRRVIKVETYNAAPAMASPVAPRLIELGFVRDPPGLAFYLGW